MNLMLVFQYSMSKVANSKIDLKNVATFLKFNFWKLMDRDNNLKWIQMNFAFPYIMIIAKHISPELLLQ